MLVGLYFKLWSCDLISFLKLLQSKGGELLLLVQLDATSLFSMAILMSAAMGWGKQLFSVIFLP